MIEARKVPSTYWLLWWKVGWHMAFRNFAQVFLMMVVIAVANIVPGVIPVLGGPLAAALTVLLSAGAWKLQKDWYEGRLPRFEILFVAFRDQELLQRLLPLVVVNILASVIGTFFLGLNISLGLDMMFTLLPLTLLLLVQILLLAFAVPLISLKNMTLGETIQPSYQACARNWWPLLANSFLVVGALLVSIVPLGLGLIVTVPVIICMSYAIYATILEHADLEEAQRRFTSSPPSTPAV